MYLGICTCNVVFAIIVNCLYSCFFCFRALSTQQGGYVRATKLYYYYYYFVLLRVVKMTVKTSQKCPYECAHLGQQSKQAVDWF